MKKKLKTDGALYLVVDPALGEEYIVPKLTGALKGGVDIIQLWDHWDGITDRENLIGKICDVANEYGVPAMINNDWTLLSKFLLDGVHFDKPVHNLKEIKTAIGREIYIGVTCGNDLETVVWAEKNRLSYISFCSMFPSRSSNACDFVSIETVKQARTMTTMPIFLAGGITLENLETLKETGMNGVALISAIMKPGDTFKAASNFKNKLNNEK